MENIKFQWSDNTGTYTGTYTDIYIHGGICQTNSITPFTDYLAYSKDIQRYGIESGIKTPLQRLRLETKRFIEQSKFTNYK